MLEREVKIKVLSLIFIILTLAACSGKDDNPPAAVLHAQSLLAEQLDVPLEEIEIISMEEVEWTDSCFGLGGPAEICAAEITPGWQVYFDVHGKQYEVRSNQTGTIVRTPQN